LQLNARSPEEVELVRTNAISLNEVESSLTARALVDETSVLGGQILFEALLSNAGFQHLDVTEPLNGNCIPHVLINLGKEWNQVNLAELVASMKCIHEMLIEIFNGVKSSLFDGYFDEWHRPTPKHNGNLHAAVEQLMRKLPFLSPGLAAEVVSFVSKFNSKLLTHVELLRQKPYQDIAAHIYPLGGLCYAIALSRNSLDGNIYMCIRPQIFADTGAAGLFLLDDVNVKLQRSKLGSYTPEEIAIKQKFQRQFIIET
jgi:hypothetical protein